MDLKLSITQLNNYIKNIFDNEELLLGVSVYGEVSGYKISSGNAYFDLKEDGAQLSCIEFGAHSEIKDGDLIAVTGRLNYHVRLGKLSFVAQKIEPYGMGELYLRFLKLKERLESEGIFDERFKKQIPKFSQTVGVVTSETGAVIHDIIRVARRKNPYTKILLYPAKVQGIGAEEEICAGIKYLDGLDNVDVIIVARGGGSFEDLAPFNSEAVARTVFEAKKPIVSGVGHETDFTLCDFASDLRASTPSVASEICVFDYYQEKDRIEDLLSFNLVNLNNKISSQKDQLSSVSGEIIFNIKLDLNNAQKRQNIVFNSLINSSENLVKTKTHNLEIITSKIEGNNPLSKLKLGYSKLTKNKKIITSVRELKVGEDIENELADGKIYSVIKKVEEK